MKTVLFSLLLLINYLGFSQTVMKMPEAYKKYNQDSLHKVYFDRLMTDEILEVFQTSNDFFVREWRGFTQAYGRYLHDQHFNFGRQMKATIEVCFNKDEKIDLFFIKVNDANFTEEQYNKLLALTKEFCKSYKFTLDAAKPFMNSGTVTFMD
jgi:hypothetical protein